MTSFTLLGLRELADHLVTITATLASSAMAGVFMGLLYIAEAASPARIIIPPLAFLATYLLVSEISGRLIIRELDRIFARTVVADLAAVPSPGDAPETWVQDVANQIGSTLRAVGDARLNNTIAKALSDHLEGAEWAPAPAWDLAWKVIDAAFAPATEDQLRSS